MPRANHPTRARLGVTLPQEVPARARRRVLLSALSASCILLGGFTGAYLARDGVPERAQRSTVAVPPMDEPAQTAVATGATAGPRDGARVSLALPGPGEPLERPNGAGRAALGVALDALADEALTLPPASGPPASGPPASGPHETLGEAAEAAYARLYEEPLATAAGRHSDAAAPAESAALRKASLPALPEVEARDVPAWQRFAVAAGNPGNRPMIAVVLDDLGLNRPGTRRAIELPGPLTLAFMTYAEGLRRMAADARAAGHELMLHVPMEPRDPSYDPGPNVLLTGLPEDELVRRIEWGLGRFDGFIGINNHMGSRFTASSRGMAYVMRALRKRGLLFLDSVTAPASVGTAMARRAGIPYAQRDVFLDNEWNDRAAIRRQLARLEAVARRHGSAIGIGHPHRATLKVLARWLPRVRARGFVIAPLSAIVRQRRGIARRAVASSG